MWRIKSLMKQNLLHKITLWIKAYQIKIVWKITSCMKLVTLKIGFVHYYKMKNIRGVIFPFERINMQPIPTLNFILPIMVNTTKSTLPSNHSSQDILIKFVYSTCCKLLYLHPGRGKK